MDPQTRLHCPAAAHLPSAALVPLAVLLTGCNLQLSTEAHLDLDLCRCVCPCSSRVLRLRRLGRGCAVLHLRILLLLLLRLSFKLAKVIVRAQRVIVVSQLCLAIRQGLRLCLRLGLCPGLLVFLRTMHSKSCFSW